MFFKARRGVRRDERGDGWSGEVFDREVPGYQQEELVWDIEESHV
jgi:hypothetical protein